MDQEWTRRAHLIGLLSQQTDQDDGHVVTAQAAHLTVGGEAPEGREEGEGVQERSRSYLVISSSQISSGSMAWPILCVTKSTASWLLSTSQIPGVIIQS